MKIDGTGHTALWTDADKKLHVIDQRYLPHFLKYRQIENFDEAIDAINNMTVRGAPLIGVTAAFAVYLAVAAVEREKQEESLQTACEKLRKSRPTAVDLFKAVERQQDLAGNCNDISKWKDLLFESATRIRQETIDMCRSIGTHGVGLIRKLAENKKGQVVNILTHCNAGWLATVDWGTATAPIYMAHEEGIPVHVWVDETRPRNQGSSLTAWEMLNQGVPHTIIADNTGGHLMQHGMVDLVITGTDRTTASGDVANKIGTYLKALAAFDNQIPFYVAAPSSSIDFTINEGVRDIRIEKREVDEVKYISGLYMGNLVSVLLTPEYSPAVNYAFDVTPARLVTGLITERGICRAEEKEIRKMFPYRVK